MSPNLTEPCRTTLDSSESLVLRNGKPSDSEAKRLEDSFAIDRVRWENVIAIAVAHAVAVYGFLTFPYLQRWKTLVWALGYGVWAAFGVTAGVHRLWCHRTYKANVPLRTILMLGFMASGQNSIFQWVRDHRVHHKHSETHADPHNSKRGFFFSHVGWLMLRKHPEVLAKGKEIDMSDIVNDPVAAFSERYFLPLKGLFAFAIPMSVPVLLWNEDWYHATLIQMMRYMYSLNGTWSVNSLAHIWGNKPYDKNIAPSENGLVSFLSIGEGWHNYHHVFPYDYRAAEIGGGRFNLTTGLIDFFARIGWAYDRKFPSDSLIKATIGKRGDGSHPNAAADKDDSLNE